MLEEYYAETDKAKREAILQKLDSLPKEQLAIIQAIHARRYAARAGQQLPTDYFMRSLMELLMLKNAGKRRLAKLREQLRFDLFLDDAIAATQPGRAELLREYINCAVCYIRLSADDRAYGSQLFGTVPMPKNRVWDKLQNDIDTMQKNAQRCLGEDADMLEAALDNVRQQTEVWRAQDD